jgi:peroxiredoxin
MTPPPPLYRKVTLPFLWLILLHAFSQDAAAFLRPASPAPEFSLADLQGRVIDARNLRGKPLIVLFFFDIQSRPSLDCLAKVDRLARRHPSVLTVYGISPSPPDLIKSYFASHGITIPVLHDPSGVRRLYDAKQILPVGCLIDREFKVVSYYQGGGGGFGRAIIDQAEREVQGVARSAAPSPAGTKARLPHPAPPRPVAHKRPFPPSRHTGGGKPEKGSAATSQGAAPAPAGNGGRPAGISQPAHDGGMQQQKKVGRILNDNEW